VRIKAVLDVNVDPDGWVPISQRWQEQGVTICSSTFGRLSTVAGDGNQSGKTGIASFQQPNYLHKNKRLRSRTCENLIRRVLRFDW
jgi:hypothetical protein